MEISTLPRQDKNLKFLSWGKTAVLENKCFLKLNINQEKERFVNES
jgi:hypothetical protein